jgi:hypothetical protein
VTEQIENNCCPNCKHGTYDLKKEKCTRCSFTPAKYMVLSVTKLYGYVVYGSFRTREEAKKWGDYYCHYHKLSKSDCCVLALCPPFLTESVDL